MQTLVHIHSGWRWVVLILLLAAIFKAYTMWKSNKECTKADMKLPMFAMIAFHIQWTIGLIMYFMSQKVLFGEGMMINPYRFYTIEHIFGMTVAFILLTVGYSKSKKITESSKKFKKIFWFYTISLLIILATIPWPFRNLGGQWF